MPQSFEAFEQRKRDHLTHAMHESNQAKEMNDFDALRFVHEALPDGNLDEVDLTTQRFGVSKVKPFFVSSMTAGHQGAPQINADLMAACASSQWAMGVGSQRRELEDKACIDKWKTLVKRYPDVVLMSNLGIAQLITASLSQIRGLIDAIQAKALIIHCNPLQECIQPEGTPQFKGALQALEQLVLRLPVPVIVKETGCGFSEKTLKRLADIGVYAVDVSGLGGTHWGRIEGARSTESKRSTYTAEVFKNWGITTVESLQLAKKANLSCEVWASGGIRHGLDAAKAIALGASSVGFAKLMLEAALMGPDAILESMAHIEYALRVAMFCTGCFSLEALKEAQWI